MKTLQDEMLEQLKEHLVALKNLTGKECYNSGHFPCQCTACKTKALIEKAERGANENS